MGRFDSADVLCNWEVVIKEKESKKNPDDSFQRKAMSRQISCGWS